MNEFKDEMIDKIEIIGKGSLIHHGKSNDRIYLMKLIAEDYFHIISLLDGLAKGYGYTKIFCKIPARIAPMFIASGYLIEGFIPGFYQRKEDAFFVSRFLNTERATSISVSGMRVFLNLLQLNIGVIKSVEHDERYSIRKLSKEHADDMAQIYVEVFKTYPFPIYDPLYIRKTMDENIQYFGAFKGEVLVALASSEVDAEAQNAEMTDFATHPAHAGHHLACVLLHVMEQSMQMQGIKTLYTIARLNSFAMNKTFLASGYSYSGTLVNNTQIFGAIESMNLYYKLL